MLYGPCSKTKYCIAQTCKIVNCHRHTTAAQAIAVREQAKLSTLYQNQTDVETAIRNKGTINTGQISEDVLEAYYEATGRSASAIGKFLGDKVGIDFTYSGKDLKTFSDVIKRRINEQLAKAGAAEIAKLETEKTAKLFTS